MDPRINIEKLRENLYREWPQMGDRIIWAAPYLYRARDILYDDLCRRLAPLKLLPAEVDVLLALRVQPEPRELTPTVLYRSLLLSSGGLTKILGRLQKEGLVERPDNPDDGRSRLVRITAEGEQRLSQALEFVVEHEHNLLGCLKDAEQMQLLCLLEKLVNATEEMQVQNGRS